MKSRIIGVILAGVIGSVLFNGSAVYAAETDTPYTEEEIEEVNWSGQAYVPTGHYVNITSSNNIFTDTPTITNGSNNPRIIFVRIVNSAGAVVAGPLAVEPGHSVQLGPIPWNSGIYTLQAMAMEVAGDYFITID